MCAATYEVHQLCEKKLFNLLEKCFKIKSSAESDFCQKQLLGRYNCLMTHIENLGKEKARKQLLYVPRVVRKAQEAVVPLGTQPHLVTPTVTLSPPSPDPPIPNYMKILEGFLRMEQQLLLGEMDSKDEVLQKMERFLNCSMGELPLEMFKQQLQSLSNLRLARLLLLWASRHRRPSARHLLQPAPLRGAAGSPGVPLPEAAEGRA